MKKKVHRLLQFISQAEKLKTELRHSWTSNKDRQESVADHTWMVSLLALILSPELEKKVDLLKVLKMIIIHDLAEAVIGDIPTWESSIRKDNKKIDEEIATQKLFGILPNDELRKEFFELREEMEESKTKEAVFAQAMDKIEAIIQHNNSDISTFNQGDLDIQPYYKDDKFNFDKYIRAFKDVVDIQSMEKIEKGGLLNKVSKEHKEKWLSQKRKNIK
jgi:putative hydrolases of HD superfamily